MGEREKRWVKEEAVAGMCASLYGTRVSVSVVVLGRFNIWEESDILFELILKPATT